jgi:RNA-directed DNA polymerase
MAEKLLLPTSYIQKVAISASYRYREYVIVGRTNRRRTVYHPSRQLKALQRWLLRNVVSQLRVHDAATAYEKNRGILRNADAHRSSHFLLRMDFEEFFPSLTETDVRVTLETARSARRIDPSWDDSDTSLFVSLVCRYGHLTIGAPTSPSLANAICFELDEQLTALAAHHDVTYTRYSDDLFFSSNRRDVLGSLVAEVSAIVQARNHPQLLTVNVSKTRHSSRRGRRVVTGIVITPEGGLSLGRKVKRRIRSQIHNLGTLSAPELSSLRGRLAYSRSVEPDFINRLILKFGAARVESAMRA